VSTRSISTTRACQTKAVSSAEPNVRLSLRHAAALALAGWYLITPGASPTNWRDPNLTLPLSQWSRGGWFSSKDQCELGQRIGIRDIDDPHSGLRQQVIRDLPKLRAKAPELFPGQKIPDSYWGSQDYWDDLRKFATLSQCISTDDPRLMESAK
jgi:hypothetical protein